MTKGQQPANRAAINQVPPLIQAAPPLATAAGPNGDIVATETPQLDSFHNEFAAFHEGYVSRYIELADTKAAWTFAIASGLLAYIFNDETLRAVLRTPQWDGEFLFLAATAVLLAISAALSFIVIAPRLGTSGESVVFFGAVASRTSADVYVKDIASKSESDLTDVRIRHCYDLSKICHRKYGWLKASIWFGIPALVVFLMLLLVS